LANLPFFNVDTSFFVAKTIFKSGQKWANWPEKWAKCENFVKKY